MEYGNKDEANRAKQIAEKKMENNDFEGARKIVMKAEKLYPKLENIKQMLIICEVHCSAQKSSSSSMPMGSDKDWYAILKIKKFVDEITVKKQYKKLALLLHPDKNKFPGAEAAFKLICQANEVLSDPKNKSLYDSKIRVASGYHHHYTKKNIPTCNMFHFGEVTVKSSPVVKPKSIWTRCTFCGKKYRFIIDYLNRTVPCFKCFNKFIVYETSDTGFDDEEDELPNEGVKNDMGSSAKKAAGPENGKIQTESVFKGSSHDAVEERTDKVSGDTYNSSAYKSQCGLNEAVACNGGDAKIGDLKNESRKRRVVTDVRFPPLKRQNVSYNEDLNANKQKGGASLDGECSNQTQNGCFPTDADLSESENKENGTVHPQK